MNYFGKIFTAAAALVLCCTNIFAQEQNPADTAASAKPAFPEDAPILRQDGAQKLYYIRDVNIHGVQYLNPDILKSSAGLIPGDSIYLPSNFIANAISRLWSQRFFSDVKIGAEIEGDSLDLEVFLKERPRVNNWDFEGISKGKKKDLLEKLKLNDASLSFEPESSVALGFGFRCGFLGMLHMEIIQERLEREFDLDLITTLPSVIYRITKTDGTVLMCDNPMALPPIGEIAMMEEPFVHAEIFTPQDSVGTIMDLCQDRRGIFLDMQYEGTRVKLNYDIPLNEIIFDFFDQIKSRSRGYASFDYEFKDYRESQLVKLDILLNGEICDAFSIIVHRDKAYGRGRSICEKLKDVIPRQMFEIPIQAAIGGKIIARETVKAMRKDVLAKCYGGDISRKKKLLEKQKEGKKRMRQFGTVQVPSEAFLAVLKMDSN